MTMLAEAPAGLGMVPVDQIQGKWLVVGVDANREGRVYADLHDRAGIACFRPLSLVTYEREDAKGHKHRDERWRPVFGGYLSFCTADDYELHAVIDHKHVHSRIAVVNQARFVRQIAALELALAENPQLTTKPITPGVRYLIKSGMWMGCWATAESVEDGGKVWVLLETFGRAVPTHLDASMLDRG